MANLGSVELSISLNRSELDTELLRLESLQIAPINIDVKLSKVGLDRQLKELKNGDYGSVLIDVLPDIKGFSRKLKELPKSLSDCIDVCIDPDIKGFKKKLDQIYKLDIECLPIALCPELADFERNVTKGLKSKKYSTDIGLNTDTFKDSIEDAFNDAFKRFQGGGILSSIGSILLAPLKLASLAIGTIFSGAGLFLGETLSKGATKGLTESIEASLESSVGSSKLVGNRIGEEIADGIKSVLRRGLDASSVDEISKAFQEIVGTEDVAIESGSKKRKRTTTKEQKRKDAIAQFSEEFEAARPLKPQADKLLAEVKEKSKVLIPQSTDFNKRQATAQKELTSLAEKQINVSFTKESLAKFQQKNFIKQQETFKKQIAELTKKGDTAGASKANQLLSQIKPPKIEAIDNASIKFYENYYTALSRSQFVTKGLNERLGNEGAEIAAKTNELNKLIAQLEQLQNQIAKPVAGLEALKAKPIQKGSQATSPNVPPVYQNIFDEVVKASGSRVKSGSIPELIPSNLPAGTVGRYDPKKNAVLVDKETEAAIKAGRLEVKQVEVLIHEFRHALQFGLGKKDLEAGVAPAVKLLTPEPSELKSLGRRIEGSVEKQPQAKQSISRKLEADAYTFAERNTKSIFDSISRTQAKENFESIQGIGGAKADVALKKAEIEARKRIQKINKLAQESGIDISKNFIASIALIDVEANRIESLLEKARSLELLPVDEINQLQEQIASTLKNSIESIAAEPESFKAVLNERNERRNKPGGQIVGAAQDAIEDFDFKGAAKTAGESLAVGVNIVKDAAGVLGLSLTNLVNVLAPTVKDVYAIAQGAENALFAVVPPLAPIKKIARPLIAAGAISQVPQLAPAVSAVGSLSHALVAPITNAVASGLSEAASSGIYQALSGTGFLGAKLSPVLINNFTGLIQSASSTLGSILADVGATFGLGAGAIGIGSLGSKAAINAVLPESQKQKALPSSSFNLTEDTSTIVQKQIKAIQIESQIALKSLQKTAQDFGKAQSQVTKLKKLDPKVAQDNIKAILGNYERNIVDIQTEIEKLTKEERTQTKLGNQLSQVKSQIQRAFNKANEVASQIQNNLGDQVENAAEALNKLSTPGKTIDTALHGGAIKVDATVVKESNDAGSAVTDGLRNAASSGAKEVNSAFADLAHGAVDTVKDVWDVQSPSKVFYRIGLFAVEGLEQGLATLKLDKVFGDKVQIETRNFRKDIIDARIKNLEKTDVPFRKIDSEKEIAPRNILDIGNRKKNTTVTKARFLTENAQGLAGLVDSKVGANVTPKQAKDIVALQSSFAQLGKAAEDFGKKASPRNFEALDSAVKDLEKGLSKLGLPLLTINREIDTFKNKLKDLQGRGEIPLDIDIDSLTPEKFNLINESIGQFSNLGQKGLNILGNLVKGFLAFQGVFFVQDLLRNLAVEGFKAFVEFDRLKTALDFSVSGAASGAKSLAFVNKTVTDLKIPLKEARKGFVDLAAATRNTVLQGAPTESVFKGLSQASTVLGLTQDQNQRAFLAVTQIASKGKVSAEEIRGQLAEAIPGASQIAARSIGVTEEQFNNLLETGQIIAEDFLPRLGAQLQSEFGEASKTASGNAQSAIFDLQNSFTTLQEQIGATVAPTAVVGFNFLGATLKGITAIIDDLLVAVAAIALALTIKLGGALKNVIGDLILTKTVTGTLGGAIQSTAQQINNSFSAKLAVGIFAVYEVIKLLNDAVNTDLVKSFRKAADEAQLAGKQARDALDPPKPEEAKELPSAGIVDDVTKVLSQLPGSRIISRAANFARGEGFKYTSYADLQKQNLSQSARDQVLGATDLIASGKVNLAKARDGELASVDTQITALQNKKGAINLQIQRDFIAKGLAIPADVRKDLTDTGIALQKLIDKRANLSKDVTRKALTAGNLIEGAKATIATLQDPKTIAALGGQVFADELQTNLENSMAALSNFKLEAESTIAALNPDPVLALAKALETLNTEFNKNIELEKTASTKRELGRAIDTSDRFSTDRTASLVNPIIEARGATEDARNNERIIEQSLRKRSNELSSSASVGVFQKLGINSSATIAELDNAIATAGDKLTDLDKQVIEGIKGVRADEQKLQEARVTTVKSTAAERLAIETSTLGALQFKLNEYQAATERDAEVRTAIIKQGIAERSITEEQAAVRLAQIQIDTTKRNQTGLAAEALAYKSRFDQGLISAETFAKKEIELAASSSKAKVQIAENELSLIQANRQKRLKDLEVANQKAEFVLNQGKSSALIGIKQNVLGSPINDQTDRATSLKEATLGYQDALKQVAQTKTEIGQLDKNNFADNNAFASKQQELQSRLSGEIIAGLDAEQALRKQNQDNVFNDIERQVQARKNLGDQAVGLIEKEKSAYDLLASSIERTKQLDQSRYDLSKAVSDSAIASSEAEIATLNQASSIRQKLGNQNLGVEQKAALQNVLSQLGINGSSEIDILNRRQAIEDSIAAKRLAALQIEQDYQKRSLDLDLKRQQITAKNLVFEQQIGVLKAIQAKLEADAALNKAIRGGDSLAIASAKVGLQIALQQLDLSEKQLQNSRENLAIQNELAFNAKSAQSITQASALDSARATERSRNISQDLERIEAISIPKSTTTIDQSATQSELPFGSALSPLRGSGITPLTYAPIDRNTRTYLPPDQSGSIGLNKATSYETLLNQSLGLSGARLGQQIQATQVKPVDTTTGFAQFTEGLKTANKDIVARLDKLIETNMSAIASPRTLNVVSEKPVQDAAKIYSDLSRASVANAKI